MSDDVLDLLLRSPAPAMSIDPYAALLGGRRRLRRRRAGFASAGLAAAAVVLAVVTQLPGLDQAGPVPAASAGLTTDVPKPAATLESGRGRYHVRLEPRADDPRHVAYISVAQDGTETEIGGTSLTGLGDQLTSGHSDAGDVILGVLPADATDVSAFLGPDTDAKMETTWAPLPGTEYRAFAIGVRAPQTTDDLWFLMWTDRDGRHRTTAPADQRSAVFTVPATGDAVVLWADPTSESWGLTGGDVSQVNQLSGAPGVHMAELPGADGRVRWAAAYALLPPGVRDVEAELAPGLRLDGADVQGQALASVDATAVFVPLDVATGGVPPGWLERLTWVNAEGTRGSVRLSGG